MRAKEYLSKAIYLDKDIDSRQRELELMRKNLTSVRTPQMQTDMVQSSRKGHYDDRFNKLIELDEQITAKIDDLVEFKAKITKEIDRVPDKLLMVILRERYINMLEWHEIANHLGQSERHVKRLHGEALQEFQKSNEKIFLCH